MKLSVLSQLATNGGQQTDEWVELPDGARALPDFPTDALPDDLALLVRSMARSIQAPEGLVAASAIGVASAAIVGRVEVQPKQREPFYREPGQLFVLFQGASGERKTPVLNALKAPLETWLDERREEVRTANCGTLRKITVLERAINKERDPDNAAKLDADMAELRKTLLPEPEYLQSDLTAEAVAQSMEDHEGRAAVVFDEAEFLSVLSGRSYQRNGAAVNLQPVLCGYVNSALHGKRVGRGEWHIPRASLAVCLGAQPKLLADFMADAGGVDRGLHARFLYFLPESRIGLRSSNGLALPSAVMAWWTNTIRRMAALGRDGEPLCMAFDPYAEAAYLSFWERTEHRLLGDLGGAMQSWGSKLAGNTVRLAAILALLSGKDTVDRQSWDGAEQIADDYLIPCAMGLFLGADPYLSADAQKLLEKVRSLDSFRSADLYREKARHIPMTRDSYMNALDNLAEQGYIRKSATQSAWCGRGAKPSPVYDVNPALHKPSRTTAWKEVEL